MKVQQHRDEANLMPPCGREHRIKIRKYSLIDPERDTLIVESHTRPRVAQQERPHDLNAVARDRRKGAIEPVQRLWPAAEPSVWKPRAAADVGSVPDPRQIGAYEEGGRPPRILSSSNGEQRSKGPAR